MYYKLDDIDWDSLGLGGFLIPKLFHEALSPNPTVSYHAVLEIRWRFSGNWPAFDRELGTVEAFKKALQYDHAQFMIPFVIELIGSEHTDDEYRAMLLEALDDAACYIDAAQVYTSPFKVEDEIYRTRASAIYDAVRAGIPMYETLSKSPNLEVRQIAEWLATRFEGDRSI